MAAVRLGCLTQVKVIAKQLRQGRLAPRLQMLILGASRGICKPLLKGVAFWERNLDNCGKASAPLALQHLWQAQACSVHAGHC